MPLSSIFDFLFPPRCVGCTKEGALICEECRRTLNPSLSLVEDDTHAMLSYQTPLVRNMIHAFKYEGKKALVKILGNILRAGIPAISKEAVVVCVPIPSSTKEVHSRTYNHIELLLEAMKASSGPPKIIILPLLHKIRETPRQVEMKSRKERLMNLEGSFGVAPSPDLSEKTVIVIDDVTTTGATFKEARRALAELKPKKVICIAIAH